ncbi:MAG: hypothetical protein MJE77_42205 [Proteobacteria bacterium]|nr:hypothetical protein [Pseudomonadota bacterium]
MTRAQALDREDSRPGRVVRARSFVFAVTAHSSPSDGNTDSSARWRVTKAAGPSDIPRELAETELSSYSNLHIAMYLYAQSVDGTEWILQQGQQGAASGIGVHLRDIGFSALLDNLPDA